MATAARLTTVSRPSCWRCGRFSSVMRSTIATATQSATAAATPVHIQRIASRRPCWPRNVAMMPTINDASSPSRRPITKVGSTDVDS